MMVRLAIGIGGDARRVLDRLELRRIGILEPGRIEAARRIQLADDADDAAGNRVERQRRKHRFG